MDWQQRIRGIIARRCNCVVALRSVESGALPRFLIAQGWELDKARKLTMGVLTIAMFVCAVSATQVAHAGLALALVACAGCTLLFVFCCSENLGSSVTSHEGYESIQLASEIFETNHSAVSGRGAAAARIARRQSE